MGTIALVLELQTDLHHSLTWELLQSGLTFECYLPQPTILENEKWLHSDHGKAAVPFNTAFTS